MFHRLSNHVRISPRLGSSAPFLCDLLLPEATAIQAVSMHSAFDCHPGSSLLGLSLRSDGEQGMYILWSSEHLKAFSVHLSPPWHNEEGTHFSPEGSRPHPLFLRRHPRSFRLLVLGGPGPLLLEASMISNTLGCSCLTATHLPSSVRDGRLTANLQSHGRRRDNGHSSPFREPSAPFHLSLEIPLSDLGLVKNLFCFLKLFPSLCLCGSTLIVSFSFISQTNCWFWKFL